MIIHTYLTDGLFDWGKLFLESYKFHNGNNTKIIMDTRNLDKNKIKKLKNIYGNIDIKNKNLNYDDIANKMQISKSTLMKYKDQIERKSVTKESKMWKLYISVEDRYRNTILEAMKNNLQEDYLLHMDIDMYVRDKLDPLFDFIKNHDISIKFRLHKKNKIKPVNDNRKVLGNIIGFKISDNVFDFMNTWIKHIDNLHLLEKPKGYGQASFYYAYLDHKNSINWGDLPTFAKAKAKNSILWTANKGTNDANLKHCISDFSEKYKDSE